MDPSKEPDTTKRLTLHKGEPEGSRDYLLVEAAHSLGVGRGEPTPCPTLSFREERQPGRVPAVGNCRLVLAFPVA